MSAAAGNSRCAAVVGATGFVGSHVVACLLRKGYAVRGSSRDASKAAWLQDLVKSEGGAGSLQLQSLTLADKVEPETEKGLDQLLQGTQAAFFCAGFEHQRPETIDFMVNNALATLRAARRQKVECVVLTSSGGSTNPPGLAGDVPKNEIEHWSDPEFQKQNGRWSPAAKTLMEIGALKEVGRNQRNEVVDAAAADGAPRLCIMNPNLILAPQLNPGPIAGNSIPMVTGILKGERMNEMIPNDSMSIIDCRDLAALHVACAERPDASGRYFGVNRSWPWEEILQSFHIACPTYKPPPRFQGESKLPTQFDHTRKESLGIPLRSLQDTVTDMVTFLRRRGEIPESAM
eukprot:gnl/TRDRNA2_/TRDRNA2_187112_c0_seq1.p1 gnl/TRDRNA2_/TRDRNA2_187112_c0~~gnl/TRDRNA2_/TRDRNA2_187112_c0_seq1.p1  ORF type:complete len:346 (+),score=61.46 gnl/TRDRNA2_/TRDRNA2_187112_c0_seq1:55-1092(+)